MEDNRKQSDVDVCCEYREFPGPGGAGPTHLNEGDHQEDEHEERRRHRVSALHQMNGV